MDEWANFRSFSGGSWSARGGRGRNPYVLSATPCGSSTGWAIAAATSMAAVTLGTETDGSILCPASLNSVVGIKPTVGLTSRAGVIPITPRQDTVGPICHTVADAVHVLDAIVGYDARDATPTMEASKYIPHGGYMQFLKKGGLGGKRIGVPSGFFNFPNGTVQQMAYAQHLNTMRKQGAVVIENLDIENLSVLLDSQNNGQQIALPAEFKENMKENGQTVFLVAENTTGIGASEREATSQLNKLSANGLKKLMREHELDAIVTPNNAVSSVLAIDGMPAITVPAGYGKLGVPSGLCFGGLRGYELRLIEMAYAFEQVTMVRKTPAFLP
ncbi:unnamed protein product [Triticum turgidum subsp. durum]|uniref:Amidase domain-containing protein n=1 Tax=Triticum turgidum subsp. durum TaxID=4567 RepID=A0A9R1PCC3_TRITD|nr:unnamed protein product [Triticum turgidum subsp. durum]